ncbi:MAG: toxin-antitoxin system protein [bacterium]|nr:toxin-antitoxin system protein [bacterium]
MPSATVRISPRSREVLRGLAKRDRESMQAVLEKAVELYRRQSFLEEANRGFAAMRRDADAWKQELAEREIWEQTLQDGLEEE